MSDGSAVQFAECFPVCKKEQSGLLFLCVCLLSQKLITETKSSLDCSYDIFKVYSGWGHQLRCQ